MQRLRDERGAVAVVVAIVTTVLIGLAALAVDVSASWARKHQLQNGADAGALAVAQECARSNCGTANATAQSYVSANSYGGTADASVAFPPISSGMVTVTATDPTFKHWFAPVLDSKFDSSNIGASATAKWGWPTGGGTFPLTFSYCEWKNQTGGLASTTEQVIKLSKHSGSDCTGPSGLPLPGGFGWVKPNDGACNEASVIGGTYSSDTGNSPPSGCAPADFDALLGTVILIPIFDKTNDLGGNNGSYHIYGYAAFKFTGYYFSGAYKGTNVCSGNQRCVSGYFTRFVDLNEALDIGVGGPQLGAAIVTLEP